MAKQTYKKHLNKNNKSNNYKGNNSKKENVKIEAINYTEGITVGELANKINRNSGEIIKLLFWIFLGLLWVIGNIVSSWKKRMADYLSTISF